MTNAMNAGIADSGPFHARGDRGLRPETAQALSGSGTGRRPVSQKIAAVTIVFRDAVREDDIRTVLMLLGALQNVLSVRQHPADEKMDIAYERARAELRRRLWDVLRD
jgi:hypothetical protein